MSEEESRALLIPLAEKARKRAYAPYSHYLVGAAVLCADGSVYSGCNIENAAFGPTLCAERCAFASAIADGKREFTAIAVIGGEEGEEDSHPTVPCGVCRQFMREFCPPDFLIYCHEKNGQYRTYPLAELLPYGFGPEFLQS